MSPDDAALRLPVGRQGILAKPFRRQTGRLIAADDRLHDVGGDEGELNHLEDAAHGEVFRSGEFLERPSLAELVIVSMRLGDVADENSIVRGRPLPDDPGEVFADSAYRGNHFGDAIRARGGTPRIVATGMWGRDEQETRTRLHAWNRPIHRVRGRIEKIFGTWKRSYGLRRMRWRGLAKASLQVRFTAIAYNLKRGLTIQAAV